MCHRMRWYRHFLLSRRFRLWRGAAGQRCCAISTALSPHPYYRFSPRRALPADAEGSAQSRLFAPARYEEFSRALDGFVREVPQIEVTRHRAPPRRPRSSSRERRRAFAQMPGEAHAELLSERAHSRNPAVCAELRICESEEFGVRRE